MRYFIGNAMFPEHEALVEFDSLEAAKGSIPVEGGGLGGGKALYRCSEGNGAEVYKKKEWVATGFDVLSMNGDTYLGYVDE